jgi:stage II sporulation protein D
VIVRMLFAAIFTLCLSAAAQTVQIRVFTLFHPVELEVASAQGSTLVLVSGSTQTILNSERGHRSARLQFTVGQLLLNGTSVQTVCVASRNGDPADFTLSVPGRISRRYHGILRVSADQHNLLPVVTMDIETAVASVVAAESGPSTPLEAMKAQAVAARSFFDASGRHGVDEFCDTTHCQFLREPPPAASLASRAARETQGLVLTWHGEPLAAMYASRCGGRTRTLREIGARANGYPYFAVECAYCRRHPYLWTRALSSTDGRRLESSGEEASEHARLVVDRVHGWSAIPSNNYTTASGPNGVTLHGRGQGHGLGLCQYGAASMAAEGADFSEILRHYYPETELKSITTRSAAR